MNKDKDKDKNKVGRPTKLKDIDHKQLYKLLLLGLSDEQLADFYNVTRTTLENWKHNDKFLTTYQEGKILADTEVITALRKAAIGYSYKETREYQNSEGKTVKKEIKHKHKPPEVGAIRMYLAGRKPKIWGDKKQIEITGKGGDPIQLQTKKIDFNKIDEKHLEALQELIKLTAPDSLGDLEEAEEVDSQEVNPEQLKD